MLNFHQLFFIHVLVFSPGAIAGKWCSVSCQQKPEVPEMQVVIASTYKWYHAFQWFRKLERELGVMGHCGLK